MDSKKVLDAPPGEQQGGTQADYDKPGVLDNDDPVINDIGGLGFNSMCGLSQLKRNGLGKCYDEYDYSPADLEFNFVNAVKKLKDTKQQVLTLSDVKDKVENVEEPERNDNVDMDIDNRLRVEQSELNKDVNREVNKYPVDVEGVKQGYN